MLGSHNQLWSSCLLAGYLHLSQFHLWSTNIQYQLTWLSMVLEEPIFCRLHPLSWFYWRRDGFLLYLRPQSQVYTTNSYPTVFSANPSHPHSSVLRILTSLSKYYWTTSLYSGYKKAGTLQVTHRAKLQKDTNR